MSTGTAPRLDAFELRNDAIATYENYIRGFVNIRDERIREEVEHSLSSGGLWPDPWVQINPTYKPGAPLKTLVDDGTLNAACLDAFSDDNGKPFQLYQHQVEAIRAESERNNYVMTTGTGSGKSLTYIVPIVNRVLNEGSGKGIRAIVVYPMNALANSQAHELTKFLPNGNLLDAIDPNDGILDKGKPRGPVTFARYTGQEGPNTRKALIENPPDILLTNYVMLELILTRVYDRQLLDNASALSYVVLDELHTYRGRQGADVALLLRRVAQTTKSSRIQFIGTSATMASDGTPQEQREAVAQVSTKLFGSVVNPEHVIGETLERVTSAEAAVDVDALSAAVNGPRPDDFAGIQSDPLSSWIENQVGVAHNEEGNLRRATPAQLPTLAERLAKTTGLTTSVCEEALREAILAGDRVKNPATNKSAFAFRLHQFVSRGSSAYATLEDEASRDVTMEEQQYVPGDRDRRYFPLAFCRECGQDYYPVERVKDTQKNTVHYVDRGIRDREGQHDGEVGYLYISNDEPWPTVEGSDRYYASEVVQLLPQDWVEEGKDGGMQVLQGSRKYLPTPVRVDGLGNEVQMTGTAATFVRTPFKFCLRCGITYGTYVNSDLSKLGQLGFEGRSTATTMLTIATLMHLRKLNSDTIPAKLLNFTDNRQDASLQAGHFNDFVQVSLVRGALRAAVEDAALDGIDAVDIEKSVAKAMALEPADYSMSPDANPNYGPGKQAAKAFTDVVRYRLFVDLRGSYRTTSPNLENVGLLRIDYDGLSYLAEDDAAWATPTPHQGDGQTHMRTANPVDRERAIRAFLDWCRRELAIDAEVLDPDNQQALKNASRNLKEPWSLDEQEELVTWSAVLPRPAIKKGPGVTQPDEPGWRYATPPSSYGRWLQRHAFPDDDNLKTPDLAATLAHIVEVLTNTGFLVAHAKAADGSPLLRVNSAIIKFTAGTGTPERDLLRVPRAPQDDRSVNSFFRDFYQGLASGLRGLEAREHTAQVSAQEREDREERFRNNELDALFCSPTMELGIDISNLNVVGMRNVPPTPANYAQRSGRAGRSGQAALVLTYCSTGSPHDRFYFTKPVQMVAGAVIAPRIDLLNEDLVKSHVRAIWLTHTGAHLGNSLPEHVVDITQGKDGEPPTFDLRDQVKEKISNELSAKVALKAAHEVLAEVDGLTEATWWQDDPNWVDHAIATAADDFWAATERWCELYRAAAVQADQQHQISMDPGRSKFERRAAESARRDARAQMDLLASSGNQSVGSDFYSYRYYASEGFLPGYSFPRLPLSAFIPGRKGSGEQDMLNRPRFLAISEFGPQTWLYHDGSRYQVTKVNLPVSADTIRDDGAPSFVMTGAMCASCGHHHRPTGEEIKLPDLCHNCGTSLSGAFRWDSLFRMSSVSTRRRDRITSDEEERQRVGYELRTGFTFGMRHGVPDRDVAQVVDASGEVLLTLTYAHTATLTRLNLGWRRRKDPHVHGFHLDIESGKWTGKPQDASADGDDETKSADDPEAKARKVALVVPFVEDRRNTLIVKPGKLLLPEGTDVVSEDAFRLRAGFLATLEAAMAGAIREEFQLEDSELATVPLPTNSHDERNAFLTYEAAEGGAGVLRRLVQEPEALDAVIRKALERLHYTPDNEAADGWRDLGKAEGRKSDCEAACYDCLMSYGNQPDHTLLDRKNSPAGDGIKASLLLLLEGTLKVPEASQKPTLMAAGDAKSKADYDSHYKSLYDACDSGQEKRFLQLLADQGRLLPTAGQRIIEDEVATDFLYKPAAGKPVAIFIDGHPHCDPEQELIDKGKSRTVKDAGYKVIRLRACSDHHLDESSTEAWTAVLDEHPNVFGGSK